jgi:uncharacterized membrane protein
MSFFLMLAGFFVLLHLPPLRRLEFLQGRRAKGAVALAAGFLIAGAMHFTDPSRFIEMMPPWLGWHRQLIYASGFFEILGAIGLLIPRTRPLAGVALAVLLLAVFPANLHVALSGSSVRGLPDANWYYWLRLPFQVVFIFWAIWCSRPGSR